MKKKNNRLKVPKLSSGFTIIELLVVIVIIAILAVVTITSYLGAQASARDASVRSDVDAMDAIQTNYGLRNNSAGRAYYSGSGYDSALGFTPSGGDVIDVVVNSSDYCVRGYNPNGTKNSIFNAFTKESSPGVCGLLGPSVAAMADYSSSRFWTQISAGLYHTCAISSNGQAYCWGNNGNGQLGNNSNNQSNTPVAVNTSGVLSGKTIISVSAGSYHTCAIASDSQAYCWGRDGNGSLGNNSTNDSSVPVAVNTSGVLSGKTIKSISSGLDFTCAIASDNQTYCWGFNNDGELGNNSTTRSLVPVAVNTSGVLSGKSLNSISTGSTNACAVDSNNSAYCWGLNADGQLGNNSTTESTVPVTVNTSGALSGKTIKSISTGQTNTCAIASDNLPYCWGGTSNDSGENGDNTMNQSLVPVAVNTSGVLSGKTVTSISTDFSYSCTLTSDQQEYCWGYNGFGSLGNNSNSASPVPVAVTTSGVLSGKTINSISAGTYHSCAIASDYQAYCWGGNNLGQLGNNSTNPSTVPVQVSPAP